MGQIVNNKGLIQNTDCTDTMIGKYEMEMLMSCNTYVSDTLNWNGDDKMIRILHTHNA